MGCAEMTLLDTRVWLRWLPGSEQALPDAVRQAIRIVDQLMISAVSVWEALYLARAGRLDLGFPWEELLSTAQVMIKLAWLTSLASGCPAPCTTISCPSMVPPYGLVGLAQRNPTKTPRLR